MANEQILEKHEIEKAKKRLNFLRKKREHLFGGFDIYKTLVNYGILSETPEKKELIIEWYNACLSLDEEALKNPPSEIIKYTRK